MPTGRGNRERRAAKARAKATPETTNKTREGNNQSRQGTFSVREVGLQEFRMEGGLKQWLLNAPLNREQKVKAAGLIVDGFWDALVLYLYPDEEVETIFGVKRSTTGETERFLPNRGIGELVFSCWRTAYKFSEDVTQTSVLESICRGDLPSKFNEWIVALGALDGVWNDELNRQLVHYDCQEMVKRGQWQNIPWDFEILSVLSLTPKPAFAEHLKITDSPIQIVWFCLSDDKRGMCKGALKQGLVLARNLNIKSLVQHHGWIPHRCSLLERLGENLFLYAEPSEGNRYGSGRNNIAATFMTCDANTGLAPATIYGEAMLVRKDGRDLSKDTIERLCHYIDSLMDIWSEWRSESKLRLALNRATANFPDYQVGDKLLVDGSLQKATRSKASQQATASEVVLEETTIPDAHGPQIIHRERLGKDANPSTMIPMVLLKFSRNPKEFHDCIKNWAEHEDIKASLGEDCLSKRLPNECYVLAPTMLHEYIQAYILAEDLMLGPGHIIISTELEESLMEAVRTLPRKFKISVQSRERIRDEEEPSNATCQNEATGYRTDEVVLLQVERSFVNIKVPSSLYSAPSGGPRTVSTTDASQRKGSNPRNFVRRQ